MARHSDFKQQSEQEQTTHMESYYRLQSKIYDATRWSFLFGRRQVLQEIPLEKEGAHRILEVGCGTGFNLRLLARRFPQAQLVGLDVSSDMVSLTRKKMIPYQDRTEIVHQPYGKAQQLSQAPFDAILFSYALTMINPQYAELIEQAAEDLKPGGFAAVTDFHDSRNQWFKDHMSNHHVRMDGQLPPELHRYFSTITEQVRPAYGGVWQYLVYVGQK